MSPVLQNQLISSWSCPDLISFQPGHWTSTGWGLQLDVDFNWMFARLLYSAWRHTCLQLHWSLRSRSFCSVLLSQTVNKSIKKNVIILNSIATVLTKEYLEIERGIFFCFRLVDSFQPTPSLALRPRCSISHCPETLWRNFHSKTGFVLQVGEIKIESPNQGFCFHMLPCCYMCQPLVWVSRVTISGTSCTQQWQVSWLVRAARTASEKRDRRICGQPCDTWPVPLIATDSSWILNWK